MRAKLNNILLKVDLKQNEKHIVTGLNGEKIELYIGRKYGLNHREKNPCVGEVVHNPNENYPYIKEGDLLVVHFNTFTNPNYVVEYEGSIVFYSIPLFTRDFNNTTQEQEWNINHYIFGKIINGEIHPLCSNLICERIKMPARSTIIIDPDPPTYPDRLKAVRVSPEIDYVKEGDTILVHKKSDYEVVYHVNNREQRDIRCWKEDIIGIIND